MNIPPEDEEATLHDAVHRLYACEVTRVVRGTACMVCPSPDVCAAEAAGSALPFSNYGPGASKQDPVHGWVEAVPLPYYGLRAVTCMCGARFKGKQRMRSYEAHWLLEHGQAERLYAGVRMPDVRMEPWQRAQQAEQCARELARLVTVLREALQL